MNKLNLHTANKADDNFIKLAELFPNAVTETITGYDEKGKPIIERAIDKDVLMQEISAHVVEGNEERYQFTWPDKKKSVLLANAPNYKTLRPCKAESVDFDNTENLYIEGDNLDVLKLLQETYLGKVKMIYIDPPYNTGKDFVYADDFKQSVDEYMDLTEQYDEEGNRLFTNSETNGRYHTDWLNMIYPRLRLAKDLLKDDGVIFISIDDNEVENLKKVCNEIFGAWNFVGTIIQNKKNAKNDTINLQKNHEYILAYRKSIIYDNTTKIRPTLINKKVQARDVYEEKGEFYYINDSITTRGEGGTLAARPNLGYTVYYNPTTKDKLAVADYDIAKVSTAKDFEDLYTTRDDLIANGYTAIRPPKVRGQLGVWTWSLENFNINNRDIVITGKTDAYSVKKRTFVDKNQVESINGKLQYVSYIDTNVRSIWDYSTNDGTIILNDLMEYSNTFDNPKNLEMIKTLISIVPKTDIILDFFSGSATTAHAVMQLNAEDGGNRKFIMVQLPEVIDEKHEAYKAGYRTICDIGKERIRRAGAKIKDEKGLDAQNLDIGFRVLKCDSTNMKDVYYSPNDVEQTQLDSFTDNIKDDRTPQDLLFQVMLDLGVLLSCKIETEVIDGKNLFVVYQGSETYLIACFDSKVSMDVVTAIAKRKPYYAVFRDSSMTSDSLMTSFEQIFEAYSKDTIRKVL